MSLLLSCKIKKKVNKRRGFAKKVRRAAGCACDRCALQWFKKKGNRVVSIAAAKFNELSAARTHSVEMRRQITLPYQATLHLEGLDLDDAKSILKELSLVLHRWLGGGHLMLKCVGCVDYGASWFFLFLQEYVRLGQWLGENRSKVEEEGGKEGVAEKRWNGNEGLVS